VYHSESKQAEAKLRNMEQQKTKMEQQGAKGSLSRKYRSVEKQTEKVTSVTVPSASDSGAKLSRINLYP